jgi:acyl-CoA synthetase (AMP-forming)/AMP-acid ligase II
VTAVAGGAGFAMLSDALTYWSRTRPSGTACVFVHPDLTVEQEISYADLENRTRRAAIRLLADAAPGERVILLLPHGADFLVAFLGCLRAGLIAVPLYPPRPGARSDRITRVVQDCQASCVVVPDDPLNPGGFGAPHIRPLTAAQLRAGSDGPADLPAPGDDAIAFLQYTSGSTGQPKGVMVSHRNLARNEAAIGAGFGVRPDDVIVSWLPMYHDMGLIGTTLLPLRAGLKAVFLDTLGFLHDPLGWLRVIAAYHGTCSGGPNFAYGLLADRYDPGRLPDVDLRTWRIAFNGAEPVDHKTMDRFAGIYGPHGFRPAAFLPCYGLAEATLFVTGTEPSAGYQAGSFSRRGLQEGRLEKADADAAGAIRLVAAGRPAAETTVVVTEAGGGTAAPGQVGEICVQGPGVTLGYWNDETATAATFRRVIEGRNGEFLRTGDLGAYADGQLYVVGRAKDLIIIAGRNFHPQDLESAAVLAVPGQARPGGTVAVQLEDKDAALIVEVREDVATSLAARPTVAGEIAGSIRTAVAVECEADVGTIVFVPPGSIPKTSSGKARRAETRSRLLAGRLAVLARSSGATRPAGDDGLVTGGYGQPGDGIDAVLREAAASRIGRALPPADEALPLASLGFDSLTLVTLKNTVETRLGRPVDSRLFFGDLSIRQIEQAVGDGETWNRSVTDGAAPGDLTQLSEGQAQILFHDQLFREDVGHNLLCALRLGCRATAGQLKAAIAEVVAIHPALRTTLLSGGARKLTIRPCARFDWEYREVEHEDQEETQDYFAGIAYRRFDLAAGPLVRAAAVVAPRSATLLVVCHHSVADLWSLRIVMAQIMANILGSPAVAQGSGTGAPAGQWAGEQARAAASPQGKAKLAALVDKWWPLRDYALLPPRPTAPHAANPAAVADFEVAEQPAQAVYALARSRGFTPFVCVATAYLNALHTATGHEQVVIGIPYHGRDDNRFAGTVGYFVNMLPLLGDFRGDPCPRESQDRTWRELRTSLTYADVPLSRLIRALSIRRQGVSPLFQATLTFQQSGDDPLAVGFAAPWSRCRQVIGGVEVEAVDVPPKDAVFPLSLFGSRSGDKLAFRLVYQVGQVDPAFPDQVRALFLAYLLRLAE